jgi:hypothetical protein
MLSMPLAATAPTPGQRGGVEQLGILGCDAEGCVLEGLGNPEAVLPLPDEARNVVRIDGQGCENVAGEVGNALLVFRRQGPKLATGEGPAVVERCLSPQTR